MPDISIITKLSIILNADIDNILEGDILYLEHNWNGLLIWDNDDFSPIIFIHGKPLVYLYISYFFLAGIRSITILGADIIVDSCRSILGDVEQFGAKISYTGEKEVAFKSKEPTMVVHSSCFIYGPNLTKYF